MVIPVDIFVQQLGLLRAKNVEKWWGFFAVGRRKLHIALKWRPNRELRIFAAGIVVFRLQDMCRT